ncbi:MAG TPA: CFI-box-CTERM domain-containing protein, partial [Nitrososphaera sp.]|nr:CFI-box-CTERM domain-containing protein [Nitrososphaera sp.]
MLLSSMQGPVFAQEEFSFHSQSSFLDESKFLHVLGEIKNDSNTPMKNVLISASFYDRDGTLLGTFQRSAELRTLNPGESSPFEILYLDQDTSDTVVEFTLTAKGEAAAGEKEKKLKIISSNSRLDILGTYYINVLARNEGQDDATNAIMIATLYDKDDKVTAIGKARAEAVPGSFDIPAGSQAAFGIAITERTQTPKTVKYSLVADSDQYISGVIIQQSTGPGSSSGNQTSGCLIATAAFGSELAPQVQQLRVFRDSMVMNTLAGSSFMNVFNTWYYSFSPSVAAYERGSPWLQDAVRISLYPLLKVLDVSAIIYNMSNSGGNNTEVAIIAAGVTASALVGLIYFAPVAAVAGILKGRALNARFSRRALGFSWIASLLTISVAAFAILPELMMFGTGLLVLTAISTV